MAKHEYLDVTRLVVHDKLEVGHLRLTDTSWDDLKFPATALRLDVAATRYSFDSTELGIRFDTNARYTEEQLSMIAQMPHHWKEGSTLKPHFHWIQEQAEFPNVLFAYRAYNNGDTPGAYTFVEPDNHVFTYVAADICQISGFPDIDMTGMTLSSIIDMKFWVDTANTSTLITSGSQALGMLLKEIDIHYEIDSLGSNQEFVKGS